MATTTENAQLSIKLYGDGFSGQIDAQIATLILDIQGKVNRLAKIAAFGSPDDKHHLTQDQRSKLSVTFTVKPGCSDVVAELSSAFAQVIKDVGVDMTPEDLFKLVGLIGGLFVGHLGLQKAIDSVKEVLSQRAANNHTEAVADKFEGICREALKGGREALESSARTFPTATKIEWGNTVLTEQQLYELRSKSPRTKSAQTNNKTIRAFVRKFNVENRPTIQVDLTDVDTKEQIRAQYSEDDSTEPDDRTVALTNSAVNNTPILVKVAVKKNDRGEVLRTTLLDVIDEFCDNAELE